jgi:hypothetical protein
MKEYLVSGAMADIQQIAAREKCSVCQVNMTMSLTFFAPDLVRAAVEGCLPYGIGGERLRCPRWKSLKDRGVFRDENWEQYRRKSP